MPSNSMILVAMGEQLYDDIKFITQHNPTQVVDEDTAKMYNLLLDEVRGNYPFSPQIQGFEPMSPRTLKYKDALVVVGQLSRLLKLLSQGTGQQRQMGNQGIQQNQQEESQEMQQGSGASQSAAPWLPPNRSSTPTPSRGVQQVAMSESQFDEFDSIDESVEEDRNQQEQSRAGSNQAYPADPELYGPNPPLHMNEDGTVRFSMDE